MTVRNEAMGYLDLSLALLSLASGVADATAFLKLGTVFTSAMTGNTVLLCIAIGQGRVLAASRTFDAFASFLAGAAIAAAMFRRRAASQRTAPALLTIFLLELSCLLAFALAWVLAGPGEGHAWSYGLITLSALAMGMQGVAARQINTPGINTIVFTSTMIGIVISLTDTVLRRTGNHKVPFATKRQIGILLVYGLGAVLAGALIGAGIGLYVWLPLAAVAGAGACYEFGHARDARAR